MRTCIKCNTQKELQQFYNETHCNICKECKIKTTLQYYKLNKIKLIDYQKERYNNIKEDIT